MELDPKKVVEVYERYEAVGDQFLLVRNQSLLKEKTLLLSELGALADSVPPSVIRSLITLKDKPSVQ
ncbi:hypothetical protein F2Q70_00037286 [Brassica cretica]|uniref:Uncharacterized protein n=1 Tax=Brassica cretica TaxID=69181 RepID=A0A8S9JRJ5_BRACR|nr:hypothetical protein F2Q70_00037286 [Brassica cretica]